jgi:hypothetical protein
LSSVPIVLPRELVAVIALRRRTQSQSKDR